MTIKRSDQIELLLTAAHYTDTGEWKGIFTYPNCGTDLVAAGLATEEGKITRAGRAALFLLDKGPETEPDTSVIEFSIPLPEPTP